MAEGRGLRREGFVEEKLARGGEKEVRSADDFRDRHGDVVGNDGQFVGGAALPAPDEEVPEVPPRDEGFFAEESIGEMDGTALRNAEAPVQRRIRGVRINGFLRRAEFGGEADAAVRLARGIEAEDVFAGKRGGVDPARRDELCQIRRWIARRSLWT